jgi:hypothetical protein
MSDRVRVYLAAIPMTLAIVAMMVGICYGVWAIVDFLATRWGIYAPLALMLLLLCVPIYQASVNIGWKIVNSRRKP